MRLNMEERFGADTASSTPIKENEFCSNQGNRGCNYGVFSNKTFVNSRRALRTGAEKISRTFKSVKKTFGNLSQHLRPTSRRRHRLAEATSPCRTPCTPQKHKQLLGRTPTKLYSPFGIETPHYSTDRRTPQSLPDTPEHELSPKRRKKVSHPWNILSKKKPRALFR